MTACGSDNADTNNPSPPDEVASMELEKNSVTLAKLHGERTGEAITLTLTEIRQGVSMFELTTGLVLSGTMNPNLWQASANLDGDDHLSLRGLPLAGSDTNPIADDCMYGDAVGFVFTLQRTGSVTAELTDLQMIMVSG